MSWFYSQEVLCPFHSHSGSHGTPRQVHWISCGLPSLGPCLEICGLLSAAFFLLPPHSMTSVGLPWRRHGQHRARLRVGHVVVSFLLAFAQLLHSSQVL